MSPEGFLQKLHRIPARLFAGGDCCPDALAPLAAVFAARALRNFPVQDHEANCLFGQIVGRVDAGRGDEVEESFAVLAKPTCHVLRLARRGGPPWHFYPSLGPPSGVSFYLHAEHNPWRSLRLYQFNSRTPSATSKTKYYHLYLRKLLQTAKVLHIFHFLSSSISKLFKSALNLGRYSSCNDFSAIMFSRKHEPPLRHSISVVLHCARFFIVCGALEY